MSFWDKVKKLNDDSKHDRDRKPSSGQAASSEPAPSDGRRHWWQPRTREERETGSTEGFTIGGGGFSISRNRQWQGETSYVTVRGSTEMDLTDEEIMDGYEVVGRDPDGKLVVRRRR